MNENETVARAFTDYNRSAQVPRVLKSKPKTLKAKRKLTPKQVEKRRQYMKEYRQRPQVKVANRQRMAKQRYYNNAMYRESIKRFGERREYVMPKVNQNVSKLYILISDGMSPEQALQELNRPVHSHLHLSYKSGGRPYNLSSDRMPAPCSQPKYQHLIDGGIQLNQ